MAGQRTVISAGCGTNGIIGGRPATELVFSSCNAYPGSIGAGTIERFCGIKWSSGSKKAWSDTDLDGIGAGGATATPDNSSAGGAPVLLSSEVQLRLQALPKQAVDPAEKENFSTMRRLPT
jgi:hypothetical protein